MKTAVELPFNDDPRLTIHRDVVYGINDAEFGWMPISSSRTNRHPCSSSFTEGAGGGAAVRELQHYRGDLMREVLAAGISLSFESFPAGTRLLVCSAKCRTLHGQWRHPSVRSREWNIDTEAQLGDRRPAGRHVWT